MSKKIFYLLLVVPALFTLAACSSLKLPGTSSSSSSSQPSQQGAGSAGGPNFANQPVESKLAIGILKLEGTDQAVTAAQAKELLPLWKAVKSMNSSSTSSTTEMDALYKQIQEAMTADQVQAIKDLALSQDDMQALMKQYNIQLPQGGPGVQNGTPVAKSNAQGSSSASGQAGQGGPGGFPGGGDPGGMPPDGGPQGGTGQTGTRPTLAAGQARRPGGGINSMFIDPVIQLLETKASS